MLRSTKSKVLVIVLAVVLVGLASVAVLSQQNNPPMGYPGQDQGNPPPYPGQGQMNPGQMGPGPMGPNQPGGQGYGGGMGMPMMGRMGGSAAIAATADYVYVVQGTTLYQFSAKTLKLENKAELTTSTARSQNPATTGQGGGGNR